MVYVFSCACKISWHRSRDTNRKQSKLIDWLLSLWELWLTLTHKHIFFHINIFDSVWQLDNLLLRFFFLHVFLSRKKKRSSMSSLVEKTKSVHGLFMVLQNYCFWMQIDWLYSLIPALQMQKADLLQSSASLYAECTWVCGRVSKQHLVAENTICICFNLLYLSLFFYIILYNVVQLNTHVAGLWVHTFSSAQIIW